MIGVEGHNPSGHCLIATKVIDYLPSSLDDDLPPAKKLAMDQDYQPTSSNDSRVLSLVCIPCTLCSELYLHGVTYIL